MRVVTEVIHNTCKASLCSGGDVILHPYGEGWCVVLRYDEWEADGGTIRWVRVVALETGETLRIKPDRNVSVPLSAYLTVEV